MAVKAVLTGDIVNSTKLKAVIEKKLVKSLQEILSPYQYEFYRGDSFQVLVKKPQEALRVALLCRTAAINISKITTEIGADVRLSIGLGTVGLPVKTLGAAKAEAFVLSGRAFDELAIEDSRLAIATVNNLANVGLQVIADYLDIIFSKMTGKQAEVIFALLQQQSQRAVAASLKKSASTVHQHVVSGRWNEIARLLQQYENIINQLP